MRALFEFAKTTVIGGLLFLVPVVLLVMLGEKALAIAAQLAVPLAAQFPESPVLGVAGATLLGIVLLLVLCFVAGLAARTGPGKRFFAWVEERLLSQFPGYVLVRHMIDDIGAGAAQLREGQEESVLVLNDDAWQLGVVIETLPNGRVAVFVPDAPSPLSGSLFFMTPDRVRPSGLKVSEAAALLRRLGRGAAVQMAHIE